MVFRWICIYFTSETGIFSVFHVCEAKIKILRKLCLTSEINTYSKSLNFLLITFSLFLSNFNPTGCKWRDITIACNFYIHHVKILACERYLFYSMNETRYLTAENVIIYVISQNLDFWKEHYKPQSGGYRIIFFSIA